MGARGNVALPSGKALRRMQRCTPQPEALSVRVAGKNIAEASELSIRAALAWFGLVLPQLTPQRQEIAGRILREIVDRLRFLVDVGLDYLSLARGSATLSGGGIATNPPGQPDRLRPDRSAVRPGRTLDRPAPARQRTSARHVAAIARPGEYRAGGGARRGRHPSADHLIDMGPAAGINGGHVIAEGTPAEVAANPRSLTGDYLAGRRQISGAGDAAADAEGPSAPRRRRAGQQPEECVRRVSAWHIHLRDRGVRRRQSTLVIDTLYKAAARRLMGAGLVPSAHDRIEGLDQLDKIIDIDQSPIGRTPRSNPATYTDLFAPFATGSPNCPRPGHAATSRAGSASTSKAAGARPARATAC